jgi:hypothetical protein
VSAEGPSGRRRRRRRLWALVGALVLAGTLAGFITANVTGCTTPALHVSVTLRNTGTLPLSGLSLDQRDGGGHAVIPVAGPGTTVSVTLTNDEKVGASGIDLVDDVTGRNYALPPASYQGSLRGTIDVEASRPSAAAGLQGRARSRTDSGAQGWRPLRED